MMHREINERENPHASPTSRGAATTSSARDPAAARKRPSADASVLASAEMSECGRCAHSHAKAPAQRDLWRLEGWLSDPEVWRRP